MSATFSIAEQDVLVPDTSIRLKFLADPADYSNCILRVYGGDDGRYMQAVFNRNGAMAGEPKMIDPAAPKEAPTEEYQAEKPPEKEPTDG